MNSPQFIPATPSSLLDSIFGESDILFRNVFVNNDPFHRVISDASIKYPIMDVKYDDDNLYITIVVNGIKKEDIAVLLTDDIIEIKYDKVAPVDKFKYIYQKISKKSFDVKWKINKSVFDISEDKINIDLVDGEMTITIPMLDKMKPKKPINIKIK